MKLAALALLAVLSGCATAPVRDVNAERIDAAMAPEHGEVPQGITLGNDAPALAAPFPGPMPVQRVGYYGPGRVQRPKNDFPGVGVY